jgi:hypothetical protein
MPLIGPHWQSLVLALVTAIEKAALVFEESKVHDVRLGESDIFCHRAWRDVTRTAMDMEAAEFGPEGRPGETALSLSTSAPN